MERVETTGTFGGVLGNGPVLRLLESALERGEAAHAYLFYGQPGVGKRTAAYRFGAELVAGGDDGARSGEPPVRGGAEGLYAASGHPKRPGGERPAEDT